MMFRCNCHNPAHVFSSIAELREHTGALPIRALGVENHQEWLANLDVTAPIPKLVPRAPTSRVQQPTASFLAHSDAAAKTLLQNQANVHIEKQKSIRRRPLREVGEDDNSVRGRWLRAFNELPLLRNYILFLLSFGSPKQLDEMAPQMFNAETHKVIMTLHDLLDRDKDGKFTMEDMIVVSEEVFHVTYARKNFTRLDKQRSGEVTLMTLFRILFPHTSNKRLVTMHENFCRPPEVPPTTRELLGPVACAEIDRSFEFFKEEGTSDGGVEGVTMAGLLSKVDSLIRDRKDKLKKWFDAADGDKDGILSRDEYTEFLKSSYHPFRAEKSAVYVADIDSKAIVRGCLALSHPLDRDKTIVKQLKPDFSRRPYGLSELKKVVDHNILLDHQRNFDEKLANLHCTPEMFTRWVLPNSKLQTLPDIPGIHKSPQRSDLPKTAR